MKNSDLTSERIRVLVFGHKEFSQLMTSVMPEFDEKGHFRIIDTIVGSVREIEQHITDFNPDVIVSAGANAAYLKSALDIPVLSLDSTPGDIISAVKRAAQVSRNIVMINFAQASPVVPILETALNVSIQEEIYTTSDQARELFQLTRRQPNVVYVGASLVCGLAAQYEIPAFLLYSPDSCRKTLSEAIAAGRNHIKTQQRTALTDWLINQSKTPIFMTDEQGRSVVFNQAAYDELGVDSQSHIELESFIHSDAAQRLTDGECQIHGTDWWFHQDCVLAKGNPSYVYQFYRKKPKSEKQLTSNRHNLVYSSPALVEVINQVKSFSASPSNVLIFGESGTGKELIARSVHQHSPYCEGRFVALNCSAIPTELFEGELFGYRDGAFTGSKRGGRKGLIEEAQNGVLFLDEISELALDQQSKLLRFMQERHYRPLGSNEEKPVNLKLVAASNKPLRELVEAGTFREDLFFRLNVFNIHIPALRERPEDIKRISEQKLGDFIASYQLPFSVEDILPPVISALSDYAWPGNVRELENVLERLVAYLLTANSTDNIQQVLRQIAPEMVEQEIYDLDNSLVKAKELELVAEAMTRFNGDKRRAAAYLGLSQTTLWRRLKRINNN
ncbi:sigma 54-interacting transcriptional regulator [Paraglaciecola chathamensis]|uniref:sigma 54-interacting transcriptional regulator n=1 Tax=Paraglaciecola chathamensis TaxID=368405 RepID=UPI002701102E|nr:sigma 54-interacting transcriptional regulator [Paraglaciecola chathamensis]MDO6839171.1 sigma 54-interacting transcriptional regulator [Paraglaciecola chathamensis]